MLAAARAGARRDARLTAPTARLADWRGDPTWLSGETRISQGELIHDDWLYDDYGADLDNGPEPARLPRRLAPTRGDYRYPTNSRALRLQRRRPAPAARRGGRRRAAHRRLPPDDEGARRGGDHARDRQRRAPREAIGWPDGVGIDTPGADHFITFWGTGGWITDGRGRRDAAAPPGGQPGRERDRGRRAVARRSPRLRGRTVTLYVVSGLADPQTRRLPAGAGRAADRDGARRRRCPARPPCSTSASTRRGVHAARSAATGARSASRAALAQRDLSGPRPATSTSPTSRRGVDRPLRARARSLLQPHLPLDAELRRGHRAQAPDRRSAGRQPRPAVPVAAPAVRALPARRLRARARPRRCCSTATRST